MKNVRNKDILAARYIRIIQLTEVFNQKSSELAAIKQELKQITEPTTEEIEQIKFILELDPPPKKSMSPQKRSKID